MSPADPRPRRSSPLLLVALGVDNFGSGLFLPLPILYAIQVIGLPLATAGTAITIGTFLGVCAPPLAGRLVDRVGPRRVVIGAQLLQAAGAGTYLIAGSAIHVLLAAALLAMGQQTFYSAVFALIADSAGPGPKDRTFAVASIVRGASFGLGAFSASLLTNYSLAIAIDGITFLAAGALLLFLPETPPHPSTDVPVSVWRNRPFLALIGVTALFGLTVDFFLVGIPVYVVEILHGPAWLPGAMLTLLTAVGTLTATLAIRLTRKLWRTTSMAIGAALYLLWALASLAALALPAAWRPPYLLAATLVLVAANVISARANALAEAAAPRATRGRHLAAFQYAFTAAGIAAPGVVALFAVATWLPWIIVAATAAAAAAALPWLARKLPRHAVTGEDANLTTGNR
ncbi:MFS transporter [Actinokineospora sp. NBRC 105648]|uniref:MFS transporter n=1 Tax=Actinokineospora sp. NBRC 105648 TaxID=3032206 RepID=UPI0024A153B5|nr:MFS transporter [Actinokineospora sp. NBRC 105648]GLZ41210.1 MFS transporter [Actinokineospora sp. NBRC 105648]